LGLRDCFLDKTDGGNWADVEADGRSISEEVVSILGLEGTQTMTTEENSGKYNTEVNTLEVTQLLSLSHQRLSLP
jgi:hypothetical protein